MCVIPLISEDKFKFQELKYRLIKKFPEMKEHILQSNNIEELIYSRGISKSIEMMNRIIYCLVEVE